MHLPIKSNQGWSKVPKGILYLIDTYIWLNLPLSMCWRNRLSMDYKFLNDDRCMSHSYFGFLTGNGNNITKPWPWVWDCQNEQHWEISWRKCLRLDWRCPVHIDTKCIAAGPRKPCLYRRKSPSKWDDQQTADAQFRGSIINNSGCSTCKLSSFHPLQLLYPRQHSAQVLPPASRSWGCQRHLWGSEDEWELWCDACVLWDRRPNCGQYIRTQRREQKSTI